jgi:threonine synthase
MTEVFNKLDYQTDPHGAIAYAGLREFGISGDHISIFAETAHPAKFPFEVEKATGKMVQIPAALKNLLILEKKATKVPAEYGKFRELIG